MVAMGHGSPVDLGLGNPAWTLRAWNNEMEDLFNKSSCAPLVLQTGPGGSSRGKFKGQRDQSRIYRAASSVHTEYVVYMHYGIFYHLRRTKCRVYTYGPLRRENKGTEEAKVCLRQIPALLFFFFHSIRESRRQDSSYLQPSLLFFDGYGISYLNRIKMKNMYCDRKKKKQMDPPDSQLVFPLPCAARRVVPFFNKE